MFHIDEAWSIFRPGNSKVVSPDKLQFSSHFGCGNRALPHALPKHLSEFGMVFQEAIKKIVVFFKWNHLKYGHAIYRDDDRFIVANVSVTAQPGLGFTQGDDFHDAS